MSHAASPSRPIPEDLLPWVVDAFGATSGDHELVPVAGDASNRRYFRLADAGRTAIVMEAPPATEKNDAFLSVRELLASHGVRVPQLLAADLGRGYLLLEDLGNQMLLPLLNEASVDGWYWSACQMLLGFAGIDAAGRIPDYDRALLEEELSRLPAWFFRQLLGMPASGEEEAVFADAAGLLVDSALAQPRVFVHRDFHSRNLMVVDAGGQGEALAEAAAEVGGAAEGLAEGPAEGAAGSALAVIDFQDAVFGPITYDLVSLLRDCYIRWPRDRVEAWALAQRDALQSAGKLDAVDDATFLRWFDLMGLQRHLKVLGTFARLYLRDGKAGYLDDLPLVIAYVEEVLGRRSASEPALASFYNWWRKAVTPAIAQQGWAAA
ncbi:aminoglycoside phosphotransferase family protein [Parahaliea maris]|uniref:aminoglycoside phosphotransferase family protein n=1 Tax=Parahaliea maris TaxID=2716870 RepID=UPI001F29D8E5|nr:phosphotransferase [Parahaliea maris]